MTVAPVPSLRLAQGSHNTLAHGMCVMEAVSYIASEPWNDHPACACPAIAAFARGLNDRMNDEERQRLAPYVLRIAGSKASEEIYIQRGYLAADFAVRIALPIALEARGHKDWASEARAIPPIIDRESARSARDATAALRAKARATAAAYADADAATATAADAANAAAHAAHVAEAAYAAYTTTAGWRRRLTDESLALLDRMLALHEAPAPDDFIARLNELAQRAAA